MRAENSNPRETVMNRLRWLFVCVVAGVGVAAWGQKIDLKVNYEPSVYVTTQTTTTTTTRTPQGRNGQSESVSRTRTVVGMERSMGQADADGQREITLTFRRAKWETLGDDGSVIQTYDTATDTESTDRMVRAYRAVIDDGMGKITTVVDQQQEYTCTKGAYEAPKAE